VISSKSSSTAWGKEALPVMLLTWHIPLAHLHHLKWSCCPTLISIGYSCINSAHQPCKLCEQQHLVNPHRCLSLLSTTIIISSSSNRKRNRTRCRWFWSPLSRAAPVAPVTSASSSSLSLSLKPLTFHCQFCRHPQSW